MTDQRAHQMWRDQSNEADRACDGDRTADAEGGAQDHVKP